MSALARLWSLRDDRPVFVAVAGGALAFFLAYPLVDVWLRSIGVAPPGSVGWFWDFGAYTSAIDRWSHGEPLYLRNDNGGFHGSYLYPPVFLLVFWPFASVFQFREAAMAFELTSLAVLWVGLQLAVSELGVDLAWYERGLLLWAILGFQPVLLAVKMGQTAPLLAGTLAFALYGLLRGADGSRLARYGSGACTAFVGLFKLPYASAGAHLLADRDRLAGAVVTGLVLVTVSVAAFGLDAHRTYVDVLAWGVERGGEARSPALWLAPYFKPLSWVPGALGLRVGSALAIGGYAALSPPEARREVFALGVAAVPLIAPLAYAYYLAVALPAFVALLAVELDRDGRPALAVVGLVLVALHSYGLKFMVDVLPAVIPGYEVLRPAYPLFQPGLWGCLVLVGLAGVRVAESVPLAEYLPVRRADDS